MYAFLYNLILLLILLGQGTSKVYFYSLGRCLLITMRALLLVEIEICGKCFQFSIILSVRDYLSFHIWMQLTIPVSAFYFILI